MFLKSKRPVKSSINNSKNLISLFINVLHTCLLEEQILSKTEKNCYYSSLGLYLLPLFRLNISESKLNLLKIYFNMSGIERHGSDHYAVNVV